MNRLLAAILLAVLAGCSVPQMVTPYRMEIQQGNFVSQAMVAQLRPGMTREQVRFVLGTPLLVDPFRANRWDYVFSRTPERSRELEQRRITVFFDKDGLLERVSGDVVASANNETKSPAKPAPGPEAGTTAKPGAK